MKKIFLKFVAILAIILSGLISAEAQIVIKVRPGPTVVRARPVRPGPTHVWIAGDYVWRGGQYVYTDGYWVVPPQRHRHWKEGHWKQRRGGWVWLPGRWR